MPTTSDNSSPTENVTVVQLRASLVALRDRSRALLRERFEQLHALESRLQGQIADLIALLESEKGPQADDAASDRITALEAEVRRLQKLRTESENALDEARVMLAKMEDEASARQERGDGDSSSNDSSANQNSEEVDRLQRRLEMALQEIRELKDQNAELASRPVAAPRAVEVDSKLWDWETQKKRLLQELESDFDATKPEQAKEKLKIEEVIRTTNQVVAEKDREIEELKQRIEELSNAEPAPVAQPSIHAADVEEAVRTEKEQLTKLQDEWREKLRKAEVEISIERAKLARERLQLEEKFRNVQNQAGTSNEETAKAEDPKAGPASRGRWLTRLGLGGSEQPPRNS